MMTDFRATFNDGLSARRHEVVLKFTRHHMTIAGLDGHVFASWAHTRAYLVQKHGKAGPWVFSVPDEDEPRLTVIDAEAYDYLFSWDMDIARRKPPGRAASDVIRYWWPYFLAGAVAMVMFYLSLPVISDQIAKSIPMEKERDWFANAGGQIDSFINRFGTCDGVEGQEALDRLTADMLALHRLDYDIDVQVVDMSMVNAFATIGGRVFIMRGLLEEADSANEVAGVLAHEIGHVIERHVLRGMIRTYGIQMIITVISGADTGGIADLGATLLGLSYSREDEMAADNFALSTLNQMNIDVTDMAAFFDKLSDKADGGPDNVVTDVLNVFSTHPVSVERAENIRTRAHGTGDAMTEEDWHAVQAICQKP